MARPAFTGQSEATEGLIIIENCLGRIFHCDQSSSNKGWFSGCREGLVIHELHSAVGLCGSHGDKDGEMKVLDLSARAWLVESSSFVLSERPYSHSRERSLKRNK